MYCVKTALTIEDTIKKSRFIGMLIPCATENEALLHIKQLYQIYPTASHVVFAYRIKSSKGFINRFNDAGEPSGTAGKPVFKHLEGKNIINVACVIIRYFGGIKLGAGGLTRAYGNTAKKVIEKSTLLLFVEYVEVRIELDYKQMQHFEYQLKKLEGIIIKQDFSDKVSLSIKLPQKSLATFKQLFTL